MDEEVGDAAALHVYAHMSRWAYASDPATMYATLDRDPIDPICEVEVEFFEGVQRAEAQFCAFLLTRDGRGCESELVVAFRGTHTLAGALVNIVPGSALVALEPTSEGSEGSGARVHLGYFHHYGKVRDDVLATVRRFACTVKGTRITVVGHSMGGACASICAFDLSRTIGDVGCATFGSPPVGNGAFCREFRKRVAWSRRVVNDTDPAPLVEHLMINSHVGRAVVLPGSGTRFGGHDISSYIRNLGRLIIPSPSPPRRPPGRPMFVSFRPSSGSSSSVNAVGGSAGAACRGGPRGPCSRPFA